MSLPFPCLETPKRTRLLAALSLNFRKATGNVQEGCRKVYVGGICSDITGLSGGNRRYQNIRMNSHGTTTHNSLEDALRTSHGREITEGELDEARRRLDQIIEVLSAIEERRRSDGAKSLDLGKSPSDNAGLGKRTYH